MMQQIQELTKDNDETEVGESNPRTYDTPNPTLDEYDYDEEEGTLKENARQWAKVNDVYFPADMTVNSLPAGQYAIEYSHNRGIYFAPKPINLDDLLILPDSASEEIIENIEQFWHRETLFRQLGFLWKRGVLLFGPAGSGKTSTLQLITKKVVDRGGIAVYVKEPKITAQGLEMLRRIEPTRPVIVLVEDVDAIQQAYGEADLLALLDGDLQIDNVVFIATTNYPEKLDKRMVNRPSRFDIVRKIGMPTPEARAVYLTARNERIAGTDELAEWVAATEDFSIAHLKELIVSVEALDQGFDETVERLRVMIDTQPSSTDDEKGKEIGFLAGAGKKPAKAALAVSPPVQKSTGS
jgi:SpoVK/Ycf46/Vps4 family AAA+-type ATPase